MRGRFDGESPHGQSWKKSLGRRVENDTYYECVTIFVEVEVIQAIAAERSQALIRLR